MLDPAEFLENWEEGDIESGNPGGGPEGFPALEFPNDPDRQPRMFQVFDIVALAQNNDYPCKADSRPDYWLIAVDDTLDASCSVYQGIGAGGLPIRFGSGGYARIPAQSTQNAITVRNTNTPALNVTVIAVRGLEAVYVRTGGGQASP